MRFGLWGYIGATLMHFNSPYIMKPSRPVYRVYKGSKGDIPGMSVYHIVTLLAYKELMEASQLLHQV